VGSGNYGFDLTNAYDCNVYLFDAGTAYVLFDSGAGVEFNRILDVMQQDGLSLAKETHLFVTHGHADHSGGASFIRGRIPSQVHASSKTRTAMRQGGDTISLPEAMQAGVYPEDYLYSPCQVDHLIEDGEKITIGDLQIEAIATPGHSHDHCCYLVYHQEGRYLISGDAVFFGGRIILQNTYDCSVPETNASILRLAERSFEALLPGHLNFSLRDGMRHIEAAAAIISQLGCPPTI
jgi:glyoxylase-like metal-dependent hydrolase (beta-lactamase superfamily II)